MLRKKIKFMRIKDYVEIKKSEYVLLKLTPDTSIRNYDSSNIAKAIQYMYKSIIKRIKYEERKFIIQTPLKCSYMIDIHKNNVEFYFIVPLRYKDLIIEKITEVWNKVTIEQIEQIEQFTDKATKYQLNYAKEDGLSLKIDKKSNQPLNNILNVLDVMQEGDRIAIFYNFMPVNQKPWKNEYERTINKIKENKLIEKEKFNLKYILKNGALLLVHIIETIVQGIAELMGANKKEQNKTVAEMALSSLIIEDRKKISKNTIAKKDTIVLNTQMLVLSDSNNTERKENNAIAVLEGYKSIEEDNKLVYKKVVKKKHFNMLDYKLKGVDNNVCSIEECHNFLQLPARSLLERYKCINKVDVLETVIPKQLQKGIMCLGTSEYKGIKQKAYLSIDKDFKFLTLCLIAPSRAGKTTLISNLSNDSIKAGETTILFDFCGNADLSADVSSVIPKDKVLNIDCSNFNNIQGLGYNEIQPLDNNKFELYRCAKTKTMQLLSLINSVNDNADLQNRMERYLVAASVIVFIQNGSVKDVFNVLQDHALRKKYIDTIPQKQQENMDEYAIALKELDEWSKATKDRPAEVTGTKISFVQGILNRVSKLKQNTYMELMLKADCRNNINLVEEMQKQQLICIKMPEIMFATEQEKDIYCTYWLTKIWGALQVRKWNIPDTKKRIKVNIVFDELYQVPQCQDFLRKKLSQIAKFGCKPIISCHYLGQLTKIRNELKAANSSYMLISGCDKDNFNELKEELSPYALEDLLKLKRYHALNLIKYEGGWSKFITKLPPPIKPC